jgi:O-antigen/teichoic acid export membrane protein
LSASTEGRAEPSAGARAGSEPGPSRAAGIDTEAAGRSAGTAAGRYGRGAAVLSVGIGVTGLVTYAYFSLASYALSPSAYGGITLLWSAVFITVSVLYRPVEQLLSRTIADRDARGERGTHHLRVAATIQLALGLAFAGAALALRRPLEEDLLGGSSTLYWVLLVAVLAYAASYFARGFLAGHHRFGLYGGLVLMESVSRCLFALSAILGIAAGQGVVALGIAAAPIVSLAVVPWALGRRLRPADGGAADDETDATVALESAEAAEPRAEGGRRETEFTLAHGGGFAAAVLVVMLAEQTFLNAGPLLVKATEGASGAALAGFAFNVLLIARAPLQLFQAVQTSILPHLTRLRAGGEADPFHRSVNVTLAAIAAFAGVVAAVMLAAGPALMDIFFGGEFEYPRGGLVLVALAMGLYLAAATLNQAVLARGQARLAALCWALAATTFAVSLLAWRLEDRVLQVEIAFAGGAALLCLLLAALYRRGER